MIETSNLIVSAKGELITKMIETSNLIVSAKENYYKND